MRARKVRLCVFSVLPCVCLHGTFICWAVINTEGIRNLWETHGHVNQKGIKRQKQSHSIYLSWHWRIAQTVIERLSPQLPSSASTLFSNSFDYHQLVSRLAKHLSQHRSMEVDNYEAQRVTIIVVFFLSQRIEKSKSWTGLKKSQETTWTWGKGYWWF